MLSWISNMSKDIFRIFLFVFVFSYYVEMSFSTPLILCNNEDSITEVCTRNKTCKPHEKTDGETPPKPIVVDQNWFIVTNFDEKNNTIKEIGLNLTWSQPFSHIGTGYVIDTHHDGLIGNIPKKCFNVNSSNIVHGNNSQEIFFNYQTREDEIIPMHGENSQYYFKICSLPYYLYENDQNCDWVILKMPDCCDQMFIDTEECKEMMQYDVTNDCDYSYFEDSHTKVYNETTTKVITLPIIYVIIAVAVTIIVVLILFSVLIGRYFSQIRMNTKKLLLIVEGNEDQENKEMLNKLEREMKENFNIKTICSWREHEEIGQNGFPVWLSHKKEWCDFIVHFCFGTKSDSKFQSYLKDQTVPSKKVIICCNNPLKHDCIFPEKRLTHVDKSKLSETMHLCKRRSPLSPKNTPLLTSNA